MFLFLFVAMYLPNLGAGGKTQYGTLEFSDLVIGPYILVAFLVSRKRSGLLADQALKVLLVFMLWALIGILVINSRYNYLTDFYWRFSLLKLAKFALYCAAGVATAAALTNEWIRRRYAWALVAAGIATAIGLLLIPQRKGDLNIASALQTYKATNSISVLVSMLACYLLALWLAQTNSRLWRRCALPSMGLMFFGAAISRGRGGWVAGILGVVYLWRRHGINRRIAVSVASVVVLVTVAYAYVDTFRRSVDHTLFPDSSFEREYNSGVFGIDDGERINIFRGSVGHILKAPIYGTGFFHRGGESGLDLTGSHNFFLQMFLETGVVGGTLFLAFLCLIWRRANSLIAKSTGCEVPLKAALIAVVVGSMSGEYLYGGTTLFTLFALYAPCAALRRRVPIRLRVSGARVSFPETRRSLAQTGLRR